MGRVEKIEIPWLRWAVEKGLVPNSPENNDGPPAPKDHPAKDPNHPNYAPDLHAALAAWEALYQNGERPEHVKHTTAVTSWLENHWPELGPTARKRLAPATNPKDNKNPGEFKEKQR
ncbi:hypothetical protein [Microbulbifer sp.]|uniref:hypothetical protein n=1 Tax=Microbulbifer sp. TaxID=1908541 RepID=UPI003F2F7FA3